MADQIPIIRVDFDGRSATPRDCRPLGDRRWLMYHRVGWPGGLAGFWAAGYEPTGQGIAHFYRSHPEASRATGGRVPYAMVITHDGSIDQLTRLDLVTPHARRFSVEALAVGVLGDFRYEPPTPAQWGTCLWIARTFTNLYPGLHPVGHTEIEGASNDRTKVCPGPHLPVQMIREKIESSARQNTEDKLRELGFHT